MHQTHVHQKFTQLLNLNRNFMKMKNRRILQLKIRTYSSFFQNDFKCADYCFILLGHSKIRRNFLKFEVNKVCQQLKSTKATEENGKNFQKRMQKSYLTSNLGIWGVAGAVAYIASHALGNVAYGLAVIPVAILHFDTIKILCSTFKRDVTFTQRYIRAWLVDRTLAAKDMSLGECFDSVLQTNINETMMYFEETRWTYKHAEILANKITNYFMSLNYEKGDVVAIMVTNRPEYVTLIIGLAKIGVISALINTNLKENELVHSIQVSDCKGLIVSEDMLKELRNMKDKLNPKIEIFQLGGKSSAIRNYVNLSDALIASPDKAPEIVQKVYRNDPFVYIYTSTPNSLPKAAVLSHSKFIMNSIAVTYLLNLGINDVIYNPLPLYHSTGIVVGTGPSMVKGIPVVICRKFSATKYWSDCIKYKCTIGQYVGDMCRYLLLQPRSPHDKIHSVKKMIGNGLNKEIWKDFVERFNVEVIELYGAADGNCSILNIDGKTGAVGFIPSLLPQFLHPISMIEVDPNTLQPIRNKDGLCQQSRYSTINEPGMLIGMIKFPNEGPHHSFINNGSEHKIIENVFKKGDKAYVTGDVMVMDRMGYLYFTNKTEDMYQWKGEMVNTLEVESVIAHLTGHSECAVYGVSIYGVEGKAGMAIIANPNNNTDLQMITSEIKHHLPHFACPVFVRLTNDASVFKTKKKTYAEEGFDPTKIKDRIYYFNKETGFYEPLTKTIYHSIIKNKIIL